MRNDFRILAALWIASTGLIAYFVWPGFIWAYIVVIPLVLWGFYDMNQKKHAIARNFPIVGRTRYIFEWLRPKIYQYFVEPDHDGRPFSRMFRSIVYQRAKNVNDTTPFGTQFDVYAEGYEWMNHSIGALDPESMDFNPRIIIGGKDCLHPYHASIFNISAMSFGSLSQNAIMALNGGAKAGEFYHNTGEGGISPHHNKYGGDLVYQLGTGYFGSRKESGDFDPELFTKTVSASNVKMIEIKLSQGAKPGHGGILPASKVTEEIAAIRNIKPFEDVLSPTYHKAFSTPTELLFFIKQLRDLSKGKPIGFKLCVGKRSEFLGICKAMIATNIRPDFITVDGGEGGTGAAPLEFSNSVGMPLREGLSFVDDALRGFGLRDEIKIIGSGKIVTGFHIFRTLALGADLCNSARGMMMALGCIQALECNQNSCPVGVATQDKELTAGLVVSDKKERITNFQDETVHSFVELMAAAGIKEADHIERKMVNRRIVMNRNQRYDEIYPSLPNKALLENNIPESWVKIMSEADPNKF